jgi:hypothetical protein
MALVVVVLKGCLRGAREGGACEVMRVDGVDRAGELATMLSK